MDFSFSQDTQPLSERLFSLFDSLSLLKALSQIEIGSCSAKEIIQQALTGLIRYQGFARCSIFKLADGKLTCMAGVSIEESHGELSGTCIRCYQPHRSLVFLADEGVMGLAARTGELQYCSDCSTHEAFKRDPSESGSDDPGSLVSVPVKMGGEVLAVLNASHPQADFFEPWQLHALSLFCSCLGQLLHNHRLIHELETEVAERTSQLQDALEASERLQKRYQQLSTEDELTGLHNRRYFFTEAEAMISRAQRYDQTCSLMLLDVDYFKQINDKWGHRVGDRVLRQIADALKQEARKGDLVARVGGEEFVIILPEAGLEGADQMAQRIQHRLGGLELTDLGTFQVTVSIGISYMKRSTTLLDRFPPKILERLYNEADKAMYACKSNGRNCRMVFCDA